MNMSLNLCGGRQQGKEKGGREQQVPSPLGMRREDRFLYLGPKEAALQAGESQVVCQDGTYEVQSAHLVGDHHWWAILRPRDKESL